MDIYEKLDEMGLSLPTPPEYGGIYYQIKQFGDNLCYISGSGPNVANGRKFFGKLGRDYTLEEGKEAAALTVLNMLAILEKHIGDLNRIKSFVKLLCFVASVDDFYHQPEVADGASQLLIDLFGEQIGKATRSAVGMNVLPGNIPFELEALVELKAD